MPFSMNKQTIDTAARLSAEHLDEIRASVDWQAMFAGLGLCKAEGKSKPHDFWAFSPFHEEKTPSFHMTRGALWYDFSIGEGGGPIELIQRLEGGNCYEAGRAILERGWAQASVELATLVAQERARTRRSARQAATPIEGASSPANDPIRQDLLQMCEYHPAIEARGISEATCDLLGIGYLPQGRSPLMGRIVCQVADARVEARRSYRAERCLRTGKSEGERTRVILSHLGRAVADDAEPKYLFYAGFHKSAELYGQELIWLHEDAAKQISETGSILLTEGPFDVAKAVEAGLRNVVGSFGASLSEAQVAALAMMAGQHGADTILIAFDRDKAGRAGAAKAAALIEQAGLKARIFDWDAQVARSREGPVRIPGSVRDLAEFSTEQLSWLRQRRLL